MSQVVTLVDVTPIPRFDNKSFVQARIEEGPSATGPWTILETKTFAADPDPSNPAPRSFTTELATLVNGWYRVTFIDQTGDVELPTAPILNAPPLDEALLPSLVNLARLMRSRTVDTSSNELGTFNDGTRPTAREAENIIRIAGSNVNLAISKWGIPIPLASYEDVRELVKLRAAALIELSYWPEQVRNDVSPYREYKALYDELLASLHEYLESQIVVSGGATENTPSFSYPENEIVGWQTIL